ncbi:MAG: extracellular solute-binding protein, partial [Oscillospiraceae bacterium]|nr:extracellular solute-binding protein [Oscillospiraceae bacterium]
DNSRDCLGIALKALGYSYNTTNPTELEEAAQLLIEQKQNGIVQAYVMDQIFDKMINDEAAVGVYYAGDYLTMVEDNENLVFVIPSEGSNLFVDAMCIPTCCENYDNALAFMNFMCRDDIVVRNAEETWYSVPSATAMDGLDPEMAEDPIMYPDEAVLDKCETYAGLPEEMLKEYDRQWINICLAKLNP